MYRIIEYEMNFDICTKDRIVTYKQEWFFKTKEMDISRDTIKVIQHSKEWIKSALFHYGNVCIYTDSNIDRQWNNNIELTYIPDPKRLVRKLNMMMWKGEVKENKEIKAEA